MKRSFLGLAAAGGLLACCLARPASGQEAHDNADSPTAYDALRLVGKTLGADAINRTVEITGRGGKPQPKIWNIVLKEGEGSREIEVVSGRIEAQRPLSRPASGAPIKLQELNLDSSGAVEATDVQAKKVHVRFTSIDYTLRTNDKTGKPVWSLELFGDGGAAAGTIRISASTGAIASINGRIASEATPTPGKPVTASIQTDSHPMPTPRSSVAVAADRPAAPHREVASPPVATNTTIVTTVQTAPAQTTIVDVPDSGEPPPPPPDGSGGFFTRTGRALDHTTQNVSHSLDHAGQNVDHTLRHTGATIQRFFTGRSDLDGDVRPNPPLPPPPPPVNDRGD